MEGLNPLVAHGSVPGSLTDLIWVALNSDCTFETLRGLEDSRKHPGGHIPGVLDSPTAPLPQEFS